MSKNEFLKAGPPIILIGAIECGVGIGVDRKKNRRGVGVGECEQLIQPLGHHRQSYVEVDHGAIAVA